MAPPVWTLADLITKVQNDLELHEETFVTPDDITAFINDAITDAEELIIDCFTDFFLSFVDIPVTVGQTEIPLPWDIYETRVRGIYFNGSGFSSPVPSGERYKLRKIHIENVMDSHTNDRYSYLLVNTESNDQKILLYPASAEASADHFRMFYIRQAIRLKEIGDILEKGIRPQYVISHVKCAIMQKEGDPMLDAESIKLAQQTEKLKSSLSRRTDDDEDSYLEPDNYSISEAYGDDFW